MATPLGQPYFPALVRGNVVRCVNGHFRTPTNTYFNRETELPVCKICRREGHRRYWQRKKRNVPNTNDKVYDGPVPI